MSTEPTATERKPEKPSVLVVDDEYGPRESIAYTLGGEFTVGTADRGRLALEMVREREYDAVVLDIRMPEMDGIRTLEELRKIDPQVSVIMLTGYGTLQTAQQAMVGGANQYLRKPPDVKELLDAVRLQAAATRQRRTQAAAARQAIALGETLRREILTKEPQIWQARASVELVHDLSNPLSVVVGYSALVADEARRLVQAKPEEAGRLIEYTGVVSKAARFCHHLAENWRGASREAVSFEPLDLPSVVKEVLSTVLPGETAVKLTGLPAAAVLGSKYELMRVVQNLIKNALESGAKRINVDVSRHEERIRLAVEDDGPGMSPEDIRKALGGGYTTKVNGTGLGLNICRQIVTTHGGRMEMGARPEKGLEVAIFFPALGL